eukprot:6043966-Pyramimonas_sp.AAC.1
MQHHHQTPLQAHAQQVLRGCDHTAPRLARRRPRRERSHAGDPPDTLHTTSCQVREADTYIVYRWPEGRLFIGPRDSY